MKTRLKAVRCDDLVKMSVTKSLVTAIRRNQKSVSASALASALTTFDCVQICGNNPNKGTKFEVRSPLVINETIEIGIGINSLGTITARTSFWVNFRDGNGTNCAAFVGSFVDWTEGKQPQNAGAVFTYEIFTSDKMN